MPEIGATLRETRMRQGLEISDIEASTKIRAKYLRAIENEEWDLRVTIAWRDPKTAAEKFDARAVKGRVDTESALMEELIVDQRETWVRETSRPGPSE